MAQFNLGQMYSNGDGVEQNYKKAGLVQKVGGASQYKPSST